ncbi:unnamed protein product [Medioppia subpectinata]|uniref:Uncharacterized protein n=1 Tax=Medioppia subpectinata TaxID=1979941 RepID=A0A7R9KCA2_9ACAR|nr:unnamed protein product [Medioppia subpectinata]CAG2100829.1 unnamed protein product [Medioppia subpectinata]
MILIGVGITGFVIAFTDLSVKPVTTPMNVCNGDEQWWTRMYDLLCYDVIGNRVQISDQKLAAIHKKCVDDRHSLSYGLHKRDDDSYPDDHHNDPILSCTNAKIESQRDLLNAFCDAKIFSCIKQKPLFDSVLDSGSDSTALKQQLVN